jgi:hypothetical protein
MRLNVKKRLNFPEEMDEAAEIAWLLARRRQRVFVKTEDGMTELRRSRRFGIVRT